MKVPLTPFGTLGIKGIAQFNNYLIFGLESRVVLYIGYSF
jgi:hypothetical protein